MVKSQNKDENIEGPDGKYILSIDKNFVGSCSLIDIIPKPPPKEKNQRSLFIVFILFKKSKKISLLKKKSIEYINKRIIEERINVLKKTFPL